MVSANVTPKGSTRRTPHHIVITKRPVTQNSAITRCNVAGVRTNDTLPLLEKPETAQAPPRLSRTRIWLFRSTLVAYVAIVVAVLTSSKLVTLDWQVMMFRPYKQWPQIHAFLDYFVVLGQRGPTAVVVAAWLGWHAWRHRTPRPPLVLGVSLLLLNITVGAVKYGLGRLGPHYATTVGSPELFAGGDIFPSGHTANAVVTWGVLAYLAHTTWVRRVTSVVAALLALGVGFTTIYLGTHWVSDVLLGWAAGLLILLALPWCEPTISAAGEYLLTSWARWRARSAPLRAALPPPSSAHLPRPDSPLVAPRPGGAEAGAEEDAHTCTVGAAVPGGLPRGQTGALPLHTARPPARNDRSPVTQVRGRRPPVERVVRPAPLGPSTRTRGSSG
jgi:membrane-associated phospholipid phosphatase